MGYGLLCIFGLEEYYWSSQSPEFLPNFGITKSPGKFTKVPFSDRLKFKTNTSPWLIWRRPELSLALSVWIKVPPRWLFVPSLSQLLANDPSIISDTQSADKWRDLDEIKDNCNISLIDRPRQFLPARGAETKKWTESFWALSKETFGKKIYIQSDIQNRI